MAHVINPLPSPHQLAFENLLTIGFVAFKVSLGTIRQITKKDIIDKSTLVKCDYLSAMASFSRLVASKVVGPISQLMMYLQDARDHQLQLQPQVDMLRG